MSAQPVDRWITDHPGIAWREVMATHGVSQLQVATGAGISKKHVNQIVQCQVLPSAATVAKMAKVIDDTRPVEKRDGGRRLARMMWLMQSQYVLHEAMGATAPEQP